MMTAEQLRASILHLAMQGKLVDQRPEEGTGEELYKEIQAEKKRLEKAGKIKKGKPLNAIVEEDCPFDIPESWKWVKLGDISSYAQSKQKASPRDITPEMWSLDLEDIEKGTGKVLNYVLAKERKIQGDKVRFKKGNILYSKLRPYLLKILIAENDGITTPELVPFNIYGINDSKFFLWYLRSPYVDNAVNSVSYGVKMPRVGTETMVNLLLPLPPIAEQKRIVAKIEELMPFVEQYAVASIKLNTLNTSFPDMMKKSILQEAVQGKLVPQDPKDEPASVLLKKIAEEKKRLIKEGKIKKQKPLPEITEDEIPFEIPDSWEWVRLNNCLDVRDGTHDSPKYYTEGHPLVTSKNLKNGIIDFSTCKLINDEDFYSINQRSKVDDGDILFAMIGTVGNPVLFRGVADFSIKNMALFKHIGCYLNMEYIFWFLYYAQYDMKRQASGGVQSFVSLNYLRNYLIPLPPFEEQRRIVEVIKKEMFLIGKLIRG